MRRRRSARWLRRDAREGVDLTSPPPPPPPSPSASSIVAIVVDSFVSAAGDGKQCVQLLLRIDQQKLQLPSREGVGRREF